MISLVQQLNTFIQEMRYGSTIDPNIEPLKNHLENLTFMGSTDNVAGGNDYFVTKRSIFSRSSVRLNTEIGNLPQ